MNTVAWVVILLAATSIFGCPFMIGKPRKIYGPVEYLCTLFETGLVVVLAGRVLGWW